MVDEGSSSSAANLVGFFLEFAEKLLASARSHVASEGMPKRVEHPFLLRAPEFSRPAASGSTISFSGVEKPDFRGLLLFNRERWAKAEAERCAQEHFAHDVRRDRQVLDENWQLIASPTFGHLGNQLGSQLTYEVYYAIADLCERLQTFRPTGEQLLEAYERLTEEWSCPTVMWRSPSICSRRAVELIVSVLMVLTSRHMTHSLSRDSQLRAVELQGSADARTRRQEWR